MNVRLDLGVGLTEPISIYSICEKLGVIVRIVDVNMDGIYLRGSPPRILISSLRPLSRRVFSCAHELGHHIFGHGSTLEECKEDAELPQGTNPKEFLADA
ncbi:MAG: ImmA/IrrE family metallo-endopeptidase, partial [Gammaproteobacteria bacterium]|nr:ImmA/IrrE family metallo-endopeptidase [Gammaproteobacteria bacterium]